MASVEGLRKLVLDSARQLGMHVIEAGSDDWPDMILLDEERGLCVMDIAGENIDVQDRAPAIRLNRKVANLRQDAPELGDLPIIRRIVAPAPAAEGSALLLGAADVQGGRWAETWLPAMVDVDALRRLQQRLTPALLFPDLPVRSLDDPNAEGRAHYRLRLDSAQAEVAMRNIRDVAVVHGPAGSGKTLVLVARARWLARSHPDWRIQVLCYNRLLVPHLRRLLADTPSVQVNTFGRFAQDMGHRIDLREELHSEADLGRAIRRGITPTIDGLLIDEWQDFFPAWTRFALAALRPGRGGAMLAGDPVQALYRDGDARNALAGHAIDELQLDIPYRSTREILDVAAALDSTFTVAGAGQAPAGEPVDLIWAEKPASQALAVAADIRLLLDQEQREPHEIGVLVAFKRGIGAVARALDEANVPYQIARSWESDSYQPSKPAVTVMTVHSAKGYEFAVVFLVGLEGLPAPDGTIETARWGRVGYVGATRARDQLLITYSKDSYYLDRLRSLEGDIRRWTWPDDYPEGA
ncbi:3'-5' exonuclease [Micromonospora sp. NBC_01638]|uniref:3'-5' exonuclease n=1 Tax=Micromonospora sp. NBC_01638 TaxID=2975982 RepID=UPI00386A449E|nr:ATP-binding domain-containing protein [Micromonospora sp. NBC_01638]